MSISLFKKYTTFFLCTVMLFVSNNVFAQDDVTESAPLDTIAYKKSLKGKSLRGLTIALFTEREVDSLKANILSNHIERTYAKSKNLKEVAGANITLAVWEEEKGHKKQALSLLNKGIEISKKIKNDSLLYLGHLRKGALLFYQAKHGPALKSYYQALDVAKKEKNEKREISVTNNIALVRMQAKDTKSAIKLFLRNLERIEKQPNLVNVNTKLDLYIDICGAYIYIDEFDNAIYYCEEGAKLNGKIKSSLARVHFLSAFTEIARSKKEFEECYRLLDESEKIMNKRVGFESLSLFLKFYRAKAYFDEEKYQLAVDELLKIEDLKNEFEYVPEILGLEGMYYYLARSYKELDNTDEALKYYDIAEEIGKENDKKREELNSDIYEKYDLVKLKDEIVELQETSKRTKFFYVGGIVLLIMIIIGLLIFNKKQQQKNKRRFANLMNQLEEKRQKEKLQQKQSQADRTRVSDKIVSEVSKEKSKSETTEIDPKMLEILKKLDEFEEKELFISKDSTLVEVAKKIQTNTTYLSKVINTHKEKSFTAYITDLRVDYAIERLSHDRKFRSFTIGAIAQEIGFKRSESFAKAFKAKTGLYPSYFIKELKKQLSSESE